MSNIILCRGINKGFKIKNISTVNFPFKESYLTEASNYFWEDSTASNTWTIMDETLDIDSIFTEAQRSIYDNGCFRNTRLYNVLDILLDCVDEIIIWYSDFTEDIPTVKEKEEFLKIVEEGIRESCCEVYVRYIK